MNARQLQNLDDLIRKGMVILIIGGFGIPALVAIGLLTGLIPR